MNSKEIYFWVLLLIAAIAMVVAVKLTYGI